MGMVAEGWRAAPEGIGGGQEGARGALLRILERRRTVNYPDIHHGDWIRLRNHRRIGVRKHDLLLEHPGARYTVGGFVRFCAGIDE